MPRVPAIHRSRAAAEIIRDPASEASAQPTSANFNQGIGQYVTAAGDGAQHIGWRSAGVVGGAFSSRSAMAQHARKMAEPLQISIKHLAYKNSDNPGTPPQPVETFTRDVLLDSNAVAAQP